MRATKRGRCSLLSLLGLVAGLMGVAEVRAAPAASASPAIPTYAAGRRGESLEPAAARAAGWTPVDLGDAWAPYVLDGAARDGGVAPPQYRQTYVELARGRHGDDTLAAADGSLELYGVVPTLGVVVAAMEDEGRHGCHDAVAPVAAAVRLPMHRETPERAIARQRALAIARGRVAAAIRRHGVRAADELVAANPAYARTVAALGRAEAVDATIRSLQAHLACEGLLPAGASRGAFDWTSSRALAAFQRRHWLVGSGELDADTAGALAAGSRELDFRRALRVLRERVADAAGLIEDGSARGEWGTVLGRQLDPAEFRYRGPYAALANGAADRISPATEAAARALGWLDFASTRASLRALLAGASQQVAVRLPAPPAYDRTPLELRAAIDLGDVVTADPETPRGQRLARRASRRPVLVVYAGTGADEVALVRWPTTAGGWKDEKLSSGAVVRRYKPSDTGPRLWRDLVAAPVWYAPKSTPDEELVGLRDGRWTVKQDLVGPSYRSAYGLVMLIHHEQVERPDRSLMLDRGIRTHGSVSYRSILTGNSHGCHRLYNHQALRLATFLLRHRRFEIRGAVTEPYSRSVRRRGRSWTINRSDRGYYFELVPPVAIEVSAGVPLRVCES